MIEIIKANSVPYTSSPSRNVKTLWKNFAGESPNRYLEWK